MQVAFVEKKFGRMQEAYQDVYDYDNDAIGNSAELLIDRIEDYSMFLNNDMAEQEEMGIGA